MPNKNYYYYFCGDRKSEQAFGLRAMPEDKQKPEDGQRDCYAWVNGPRTKEKNNGLALIFEEPGHLGRALGR